MTDNRQVTPAPDKLALLGDYLGEIMGSLDALERAITALKRPEFTHDDAVLLFMECKPKIVTAYIRTEDAIKLLREVTA